MQNNSKTPKEVPFRITYPELIPSKRYYDEEFYRLECENLWPHVWQMACRTEEIPEIGDWVEYKNLDKSVIVVRTQSGIKAFNNACRHRGVQLVHGHGNSEKRGFNCPFHGWRWNTDGENIYVYERHLFNEKLLAPDLIALVPCRSEIWAGQVFINWDDNAPSFKESMGEKLLETLEVRNVDKLKVAMWEAIELPVNWKLAMEAFMEGYHVMRTHPQLHITQPPGFTQFGSEGATNKAPDNIKTMKQYTETAYRYIARVSDGMGGYVSKRELAVAEGLLGTEFPGDIEQGLMAFHGTLNHQITEQGRANGLHVPDLNAVAVSHPTAGVHFLFPHFFLLTFFSAMSSYRVRPLGPEKCLFEIWALDHFPDDEKRERPVAPPIRRHDDPDLPEIPKQDYSNLPWQQLGLHANGFDYMRLSKDVEGMISNYQRLIDGYLAGLDPATLAKASESASGIYECPIHDKGI